MDGYKEMRMLLRYIFIVVLYLSFISCLFAANSADERYDEFFGKNKRELSTQDTFKHKKDEKVKLKDDIYIFSVKKEGMQNWIQTIGESKSGVPMKVVHVRFKIRKKGTFRLPYFKLYFLDKNLNIMSQATKVGFGARITSFIKKEDWDEKSFEGNHKYIAKFMVPYQLKYNNALFVIGWDNKVYAKALRAATDINQIDFPERDQLAKE